MTEGWNHVKPIHFAWLYQHTVSERRLAANSTQTYKPQQMFLWTWSNLQVCFIQFQVSLWKFHSALHAAPINDVSNKMRTSAKMKSSSDSNVLVLYHMWEHALTSSMHTITAVTNQKLFTANGLLLYYHFCQETIFKKYLCDTFLFLSSHCNHLQRNGEPFHHHAGIRKISMLFRYPGCETGQFTEAAFSSCRHCMAVSMAWHWGGIGKGKIIMRKWNIFYRSQDTMPKYT